MDDPAFLEELVRNPSLDLVRAALSSAHSAGERSASLVLGAWIGGSCAFPPWRQTLTCACSTWTRNRTSLWPTSWTWRRATRPGRKCCSSTHPCTTTSRCGGTTRTDRACSTPSSRKRLSGLALQAPTARTADSLQELVEPKRVWLGCPVSEDAPSIGWSLVIPEGR
eukprot:1718451-Rhodomonas_salina.2